MLLAEQLVHQRYVHPGPLVLGTNPVKFPKGLAVRQLKWYVSWVQNVVRQFGLYPLWA